MAQEEIVMEIKANVSSATKQVDDFTKSLNDAEKAQKDLNEAINIQREGLIKEERILIKLKAQRDALGKDGWSPNMAKLNKQIKNQTDLIALEKNTLKDLENQQKINTQTIKAQNKELKESEKLVKEGIGNFRLFGVSINDIQNSIKKLIPSIKLMFGTIKAGILSTGIGALLIAFGSLATYFTSTQRGADKLKVALTGIGAAFNVIRDRISTVGEAISLVFSGKFSEAADKLKGSFKGITDEIKEEIKVMTDLEKRQQALRDAEIQFTVQRAKTRKEIEAARLLAEDETKSQEERIDALQKALDLETKTTEQELELARERVRIQEEQMKISENLVEDEKKLADFKADVLSKETKSLRLQKRVKTEINELNREIEAEEKRIAKEKQDREDAEFEAMIKANDEWNKQQLKDAEKLNDDLEKLDQAREQAKLNLIKQGFDIAGELAGESDKAQKAVAVAKTIYNTQQAIMNAMANIPAPFNIATAVSTGIMGAMSVKNILSTNPRNASNVSLPTAPSSGTPAPEMLSGRFQLGGVEEQQPVQAYVVTDSLTDNQNKLAYIRRRATI
jgi:hypothetical protein